MKKEPTTADKIFSGSVGEAQRAMSMADKLLQAGNEEKALEYLSKAAKYLLLAVTAAAVKE